MMAAFNFQQAFGFASPAEGFPIGIRWHDGVVAAADP
jgi:hypothetical protein